MAVLDRKAAPRIWATSQVTPVPLQLYLSHGLAWKLRITCSPATGVPQSQALPSHRPLERTEFRAGNLTGIAEFLGC